MTRVFLGSALFVAMMVCAPRLAGAASFGILIGSADLDGDGVPEDVYNNLSSINVVRGTTVTSYPIGFTSWALLNGDFTSVVDLDGNPGAEIPVNIGGSVLVIRHATRSTTTYPIGTSSWAAAPGGIADLDGQPGKEIVIVTPTGLRIVQDRARNTRSVAVPGQFAVIGGAVADLDGIAGAEVPIASGSALMIYSFARSVLSSFPISSGSWAVCTTGSSCVSDLDGAAGAELIIAVPNALQVLRYRAGVINSFPIGQQYAILGDGVRDFDGAPGNDIALSVASGALLIIRPAAGVVQTISGAGTFAPSWTVLGYINADGLPGDEIRVRSTTSGRAYRVNPRSGSVSAE